MTTDARVAGEDYRVLVSTTSNLVGEHRGGEVRLTLAFPDSESINLRLSETPISRSAVMVLFDMERPKSSRPTLPLPSAEWVGQCICDALSVLYGKRFDSHGLVQSEQIFWVPDLLLYSSSSHPKLPFNSHRPRTTAPVPLNLDQAARVDDWLMPSMDDSERRLIQTACGFYARALRNAERDVEVAYLHLITAGELLTGLDDYRAEDLLDEQTLKDMKMVREQLGDPVANRFTSRMRAVRKRFAKSLLWSLDDGFYAAGKADKENLNPFLAEDMTDLERKPFDMVKCLESAYDVRSGYVHSGTPFGFPVSPRARGCSDRNLGRPVLEDRKFAKTLEKSPTFCGLERILRYCLLKRMGVRVPAHASKAVA